MNLTRPQHAAQTRCWTGGKGQGRNKSGLENQAASRSENSPADGNTSDDEAGGNGTGKGHAGDGHENGHGYGVVEHSLDRIGWLPESTATSLAGLSLLDGGMMVEEVCEVLLQPHEGGCEN